ncbi:17575_t:CDS:1, partial [Gigaspora margarita]
LLGLLDNEGKAEIFSDEEKEEIPRFRLTDVINSGAELLDAHYQAILPEWGPFKDPITTLNALRPQILEIFNDRFDLTHGFKTRICLIAKMGRNVNYLVGVFDEGDFMDNDTDQEDIKEVPFKNKALAITTKEDIPRIVDQLIWDIEKRVDIYIEEGSGWYFTCAYEVNIEMPVYEPLRANSHLPLPKGIPKRNNGIINIQNEDNRCFEWCILEDLYSAPYHRE